MNKHVFSKVGAMLFVCLACTSFTMAGLNTLELTQYEHLNWKGYSRDYKPEWEGDTEIIDLTPPKSVANQYSDWSLAIGGIGQRQLWDTGTIGAMDLGTYMAIYVYSRLIPSSKLVDANGELKANTSASLALPWENGRRRYAAYNDSEQESLDKEDRSLHLLETYACFSELISTNDKKLGGSYTINEADVDIDAFSFSANGKISSACMLDPCISNTKVRSTGKITASASFELACPNPFDLSIDLGYRNDVDMELNLVDDTSGLTVLHLDSDENFVDPGHWLVEMEGILNAGGYTISLSIDCDSLLENKFIDTGGRCEYDINFNLTKLYQSYLSKYTDPGQPSYLQGWYTENNELFTVATTNDMYHLTINDNQIVPNPEPSTASLFIVTCAMLFYRPRQRT